jgi:hypothetical protein
MSAGYCAKCGARWTSAGEFAPAGSKQPRAHAAQIWHAVAGAASVCSVALGCGVFERFVGLR